MTHSRKLPLPQLADERFMAQLGIVSIQSRIDERNLLSRRWTSAFQVSGAQYHIEGFAADFGRPRGVDADTLTAIETLFVCAGCPEDNTVRTTPTELIHLVYGFASGHAYTRLKESLQRLWRVGFTVRKAYLEPGSSWGRYLNISLNLMDSVQLWTEGEVDLPVDSHQLSPECNLVIRLSDPLAQSIRAGHIQHLDRRLFCSLEQPVARALYRILQAHRPADGALELRLQDWASLCGIISDRPDKIRRILEPAHEELQGNHYLAGVQFRGRGAHQRLEYGYRAALDADPALVTLLGGVGIPQARAEQFAQQFPDRIEAVVAYVQGQGKKVLRPGALAADMLLNPAKYALPELAAPDSPVLTRAQQAERKVHIDQIVGEEHEAQQQVLLTAAPEQQWESARASLSMLTQGILNEAAFARLESDCRAGAVSAVELARELTRLGRRREQIRERLKEWLG